MPNGVTGHAGAGDLVTLLYFSPVPWDSFEQRPHYMVRDFLASGGTSVTWVNPYLSRLPGVRDVYRADWRVRSLVVDRPEGLRVVDPGGLPIDPLPGGRRLNRRLFWREALARWTTEHPPRETVIGIGRPTAMALAALEAIPARLTFYDAMDDFPEFYSGRSRASTARIERDIAARVHRVLASSSHLEAKFRAMGLPPRLVRNAYDMRLLPPFTGVRQTAPHYGYIGTIGRWFDWNIVRALAEAVHPAPVTLVGPQASRVPARLPANIERHPPCSQAESVRWLSQFSSAMIPFARDALTRGVDPIKYYQYRAAGLPVLSTRFGDMGAREGVPGVYFLDDAGGAAAAARAAEAYRPEPIDIARVRAEDDWSARFLAARLWELPGT